MESPEPTTDEPTLETLMRWADDGGCQATDGCWLDQEQRECAHHHLSWAVVLGFEPDVSGD